MLLKVALDLVPEHPSGASELTDEQLNNINGASLDCTLGLPRTIHLPTVRPWRATVRG